MKLKTPSFWCVETPSGSRLALPFPSRPQLGPRHRMEGAGGHGPQCQAGPRPAGGGGGRGAEEHGLHTCEREMLASRILWIVSSEMLMEDLSSWVSLEMFCIKSLTLTSEKSSKGRKSYNNKHLGSY